MPCTRRLTSAPPPGRRSSIKRVGAAGLVSLLSIVVAVPSVRADRIAPEPADGASSTTGTTLPPSSQQVRITQFATASQPVGVFTRPDDPTLFVAEKLGTIRAWRNGAFAVPAVLDITKFVDSTNERGLLGMAFHPTRRDVIYVDYTNTKGNVRVSEFPFDGQTADIAGERNLLDVKKPFNEHNAGTIFFDAAGLLYIGIGDGGGSNDRFNNAQRRDVLLGKVLRIDPTPTAKNPYTVPPGNPFTRVGLARVRPEIIAYGLRNPWQISLDELTGDIWIPDVGEHKREEINRMPKNSLGSNFGWKLREGLASNTGARPVGSVDPVYDYPHKDGRCAVVGGTVYRGTKLRALTGMYVFGDVCTGMFAALKSNGKKWEAFGLNGRVPYLTAISELDDGELVASSLEGGLYRIEPAS